MQLTDLATELLLQILHSLPTISSVLALSSTCHHLRTLIARHKLPLLYLAADHQLGPLPDAVRLVTHNSTETVHIIRPAPPHSLALLQRLLAVGRTANKLVAVYPTEKWHGAENSPFRRSLTSLEARHLRRAVYRLWLYTLAFHNAVHTRRTRLQPPIVRSRAALLRPWPASELAEMLDVHNILRGLLQYHICPSNGTVLRRHRARYPHEQAPIVHSVCAKHNSTLQQQLEFEARFFHSTPQVSKLLVSSRDHRGYGGVVEGWGDEIAHYYVVEDMLKLDPGQIVWLFEHVSGTGGRGREFSNNGITEASSKDTVQTFVSGVGGEWFENNGETFAETVAFVVGERGGEIEELRESVEEGMEGVVRGAFI